MDLEITMDPPETAMAVQAVKVGSHLWSFWIHWKFNVSLLLLLLQGLRAHRITTGTKENLEKLGRLVGILMESLESQENFHLVSLVAVLLGQEKRVGVLQNEAREAIFFMILSLYQTIGQSLRRERFLAPTFVVEILVIFPWRRHACHRFIAEFCYWVIALFLNGQLTPFLFQLVEGGGGNSGGPNKAAEGRNDKRKRQPAKKREGSPGAGSDDKRNSRRNSLRIGGGKKSRAASLGSRRGSLRKRDRTAEKFARLDAADERRTVVLPE
jgi:hypothetical protein